MSNVKAVPMLQHGCKLIIVIACLIAGCTRQQWIQIDSYFEGYSITKDDFAFSREARRKLFGPASYDNPAGMQGDTCHAPIFLFKYEVLFLSGDFAIEKELRNGMVAGKAIEKWVVSSDYCEDWESVHYLTFEIADDGTRLPVTITETRPGFPGDDKSTFKGGLSQGVH